MKVWSSLLVVTALAGQVAEAFVPSTAARSVAVECNMFGGAGAGLPSEDDPEQVQKMELMAKRMGMSVEEYKLGITARTRLTEKVNSVRLSAGDKNKAPLRVEEEVLERTVYRKSSSRF